MCWCLINLIHIWRLKKQINTLYYNDLHSSIKYVDTFLEEKDEFYRQNQDAINLTLCGGDMFLDNNSNNEIVAEKLGR